MVVVHAIKNLGIRNDDAVIEKQCDSNSSCDANYCTNDISKLPLCFLITQPLSVEITQFDNKDRFFC